MIPVPVRGFTSRVGSVGLAVLLGVGLLLPAGAAAQQGPQPLQADPYGRPHPDDLNRPVTSGFDLFGAADLAWIGTRGRGSMRHSFTNDGPIDYYFVGSSSIVTELNTPTGSSQIYFAGSLWAGTPRSEWEKHRQTLQSLNNVSGGGWNSQWNLNAWFLRFPNMWRPDDTQLGFVHSGASNTNDGACTDFTGDFVNTGSPLMASSDCQPTWGSDQFAGAGRLIEFTSWESYFNQVGANNFTWDWWRVPPEFIGDELIGDWQTYGKIVDWAADNMARFGNVVPGGSGAPQAQGFPLGLSLVFDSYSFANPDVANVTYWRAMVVNESEQAYGTPLDYDSLYLGIEHGILMSAQNPAVYYRPELGGVFFNNNGTNPNCNDARVPAGVAGCYTGTFRGFEAGAAAIMVLNSPLGDLRNKQFSDPNSPFFAPGHPLAGDTITFNHGRTCGFGASCWSSTTARSARSGFGLHASIPADVFDGRSEAEYDDISGWWFTFRNHDFPARTASFNKWPIDWDGDAVVDTFFLDTCLGEEFGGPPGGGCAELWSDTAPGGLNNREGNIGGYVGFGPFALASGDTTRFTLAILTGGSRSAIETNARNAVSFYQNAYLGPESAPAPNVVSVAASPGDRGAAAGQPEASVQLFWDDTAEQWEDVFLLLAASQFDGDVDNPWLADSIRTVARNNVERIHIFKSCDGGNNFTANTNCDGDPAVDDLGNDVALGWQPYETFEPDEDGNFPNTFEDLATTPGKTYLYTIVTETRGFSANIVIRDDEGNPVATDLQLAPKLYSVLTTSTSDPNVASVYTPASRQAGGRAAEALFTRDDPRNPVAYHPVEVVLTADIDESADYELAFGDSVVVTQKIDAVTGQPDTAWVDLYRTVVTSLDGGVTLERIAYEHENFATAMGNSSGVQTNGGETTEEEVGDEITRTTVFADELTLVTARANGEPLFVSSTLDGSNTTPGTFFGRPDFPRFIVNVDNSLGGTRRSTAWLEQGDSLRPGGSPTVTWLADEATSTGEAFNEYVIDFEDFEFGPQRLFTLNLTNPQQTEDQVVASLQARQVADVTETSQEVADALGVTVDDLLAVNLPFTVEHRSPDRGVIVAMLSEDAAGQTTKLASIRLGVDVDALDVDVPAGEWVPGDRLVFLERVTQFQRAVGAAGEYVVTQNGQPVEVDTLVVTWESAMIGCPDRPACNPLRARTRGANDNSHLPVDPDAQLLRVRYASPITPQTTYAYQVTETLRGSQVEEVTAEDLERIRVVPNPYVVFSTYEQQIADRRLLFTGLPPQGKIEIYTVAGQFVQRISWTQDQLAGNGDLYWNMRTRENTDIQSGLYVFYVTGELPATGETVNKLGKFVVIR